MTTARVRARLRGLAFPASLALAACGGSPGDVDTPGAPADAASLPDAASPPPDVSEDAAIDASAKPPEMRDAGRPGGFVHPGVLVQKGGLDFVKAKIAAKEEPWLSAFEAAKKSRWGALAYKPGPRAVVECGSYSSPDNGCSEEKSDVIAAYTHALLWYFTGDEAHAKASLAIMNAWSAVLVDHTNSNAPLQSAWAASVFPRAGEIMKHTYGGWPAGEADRFGAMLRKAYLPLVIKGAPNQNGNWELSMIEAAIGIGVFLDDPATFDRAVAMWRKRVPAYVYMKSDGPLPVPPPGGGKTTKAELTAFWFDQPTFMDGLSQETCRDFGHLQYGLAAIVSAAETARIQGVDLYAEESSRIRAGLEFHAQYLDGVPAPASLCGGKLTDVAVDPMWEVAHNHFANRLGLALPHTRNVVRAHRPSGADHHMVWETLTHADVGSAGLD
jgi:hypothetical protein